MKTGDSRIGLGKGNMDTATTPTIRVEIYNQTYNIRSDGDSEYITQLAEFVDNRMREISSGTLTVDSLKVAILAALHIADETACSKPAPQLSSKPRPATSLSRNRI